MLDLVTFVTALYVIVDDFCKAELDPEPPRRGPAAALTRSEVVALACVAQWYPFRTERGAYRYIARHLAGEFPTLPHRSQFNRLMRRHVAAIQAFGLHLAVCAGARSAPYEAMDCMAVVTRNAKRRGRGWLPGITAIGRSNRVGWFEGFKLLISVTPTGVITGYGFAPGNVNDRPIADTFLAARHQPEQRLPTVGQPATGPYIVDKGFDGRAQRDRWRSAYGADVIGLPQHPPTAARWSKAARRQIAAWRQIVETVNERLLNWWNLLFERPHTLDGFQARLAAKVALHNFVIWMNHQLGRPPLAVTNLIAW
jgi:hypothetical protein